jgi:deoxyribodipyrimidine photo-lyase
MNKVAIFWFRRDLRLNDNAGLYHALSGDLPVQPIFIFDEEILSDLNDRKDARVSFIHQELNSINEKLKTKGSSLKVYHGKPKEIWEKVVTDFEVASVYCNRDYEPYAKERDEWVEGFLKSKEITFKTFKDQVILEPGEVMKDDGTPYLVFTPFSKKWKTALQKNHLESYSSALRFEGWNSSRFEFPTLNDIGFALTDIELPKSNLQDSSLETYADERDFPGKDSTSRLGIHLRFGTVSIREIASRAKDKSEVFLSELIWREFFMTILNYYPEVVSNNFHRKYDAVKWRNNEEEFKLWCEGKTGYPLVDAGMRELNETGFMHNRVRMVVASFLTKHLLIDWKWGEAYFAEKLLDYELSANNGNWQWAAGTGVDAAPYFRVFNPSEQIKRFDKDYKYIKKWVSEWNTEKYPEPMVEHKMARNRALETYKKALS